MTQKRHWMVTVYRGHLQGTETEEEPDQDAQIEELCEHWATLADVKDARYAIGQVEECPETGRLHIQAYIEMRRSIRPATMSRMFSGHYEPRFGSRDEARKYVTKSETRVKALVEFGEWRASRCDDAGQATPKQRALKLLIEEGMTPDEIADADPSAYFAHHAAIKATWEARSRKAMWRR